MREDCRHFQSRTYSDGEAARFCVLDLAPEAPWHCPENCPSYQKDLIDSTFEVGSLVRPEVEDEPEVPDGDAAAVLNEADLIVTSREAKILKEFEPKRSWWSRLRRGTR